MAERLPEPHKSTFQGALERNYEEAIELLQQVDQAAPKKKNTYAHNATVRWTIIGEIRKYLREVGRG